jgi:uncharacterized protein YfeS
MPVSLSIRIVTCRSIGGGPHAVVIENLLNRPQPDFGAAICEVAVELNRRAPSFFSKPLTADESIYSTVLAKLPRRRFEAKKARYTIVAVSRLPGNEPLVPTGPDNPFDVEAFMKGFLAGEAARKAKFIKQRDDANALHAQFDDVVAALEANPPKLKPSEFDWVGFVDWFRSLKAELPDKPAAIVAAVNAGSAVAQARLAAMDPWTRLDIDWKFFHPNARALLPDPWFWNESEDFAPNGNDDGSDVLSIMQKRKKIAEFTSTSFGRLAAQFSYDPSEDPETWDAHLQGHYFNFVVGVAFAHLKLKGFCPLWLRDKALATMALETKIIHRDHATWEHKDAKLAALERLTAVLNACPTVAP